MNLSLARFIEGHGGQAGPLCVLACAGCGRHIESFQATFGGLALDGHVIKQLLP